MVVHLDLVIGGTLLNVLKLNA